MHRQFFLVCALLCALQGVTYATKLYSGEGDGALAFRSSSWVQLPVGLNQKLGPQFSFEAWIQVFVADTRSNPNPGNWGSPNNITALNRPIVSRYLTTVAIPTNEQNDFLLQVNPDGRIVFFLGGGTDYAILMYAITQLEDYQWYHVGFSLEYTPDLSYPQSATVYINGYFTGVRIRYDRDALTAAPWLLGLTRNYLPNTPIALGKYINNDENWPNGQYFVGKMDEVRLWQGVRVTSEFDYYTVNFYPNRTVSTGVESWLTSSTYSLGASYDFNDGTGTVLKDQGPNHFHGTIFPGPLNQAPEWSLSEVQIVSFIDITAQIPKLVPLIGYDVDKGAGVILFNITFTSNVLGGNLYTIDSFGSPNPAYPGGIQVPTPGRLINSGDIIADTALAYVANPAVNGQTFRFFYQAVNAGITLSSRLTEVRLVTNCWGVHDQVDYCGVCNGNNETLDVCGVCFGDGSTCLGCDGVAKSNKHYDVCGICGGNGQCHDCTGTAYGTNKYDACGVCGGNNSTCLGGCDGRGGKTDLCGVCNGKNTCFGCDGVAHSGAKYDRCGVCKGTNDCIGCDGRLWSGKKYDLCGVCGGNDKSCNATPVGCDGVANSGVQYDSCGVCGGTNDCLSGCDLGPYSTAQYDECGVCGGTNACVGCDGVVDSGLQYDVCGVCDGPGIDCLGCDGRAWSGFIYDDCGICGGNNGTCRGCDGSGGGVYDECGVCNGDGSTCGGCDGLGHQYDSCGVCNGDDSSCTCKDYLGYNIGEMDYRLLRWTIKQSLDNIDTTENKVHDTLELLEGYEGEVDLGSVSKYINEIIDDFVDPYTRTADNLKKHLDEFLGDEWVPPGGPTWPSQFYQTGRK